MNDQEFAEYVKTCSEIELYFIINDCGGFVWRMNHDMNKGRILNTEAIRTDIANMQKRGEIAVDQTVRFGVSDPWCMRKSFFDDQEHRAPSDEYWLWFRWWDSWSKSLSDEQFREMDRALSAKDASAWRPAGDWRTPVGAQTGEGE